MENVQKLKLKKLILIVTSLTGQFVLNVHMVFILILEGYVSKSLMIVPNLAFNKNNVRDAIVGTAWSMEDVLRVNNSKVMLTATSLTVTMCA